MRLSEETVKDLATMLENYLEINEFPNKENKQQLERMLQWADDQIANKGTVSIIFIQ